jgi:surfeit locus 1 family protein
VSHRAAPGGALQLSPMMGFRPRFWPTVTALIMMAITIGLGTWQVHRLAWKTELLATIAQRMNSDAVSLPADIANPADWAFRHIHVAGRFDADKALWLYGRTYDGKAGIHLLVPLIRDGGGAILVDRGFVPIEHGNVLDTYRPADGPAEIDGIVRLPEPGGLFVPGNEPDKNIWYSVDIPSMSKATGQTLAPVYITAKSDGSTGWPAATGGTEGTGIRNEHLNYAIFWYSMALVLAVIYLMSSRVRPKSSER